VDIVSRDVTRDSMSVLGLWSRIIISKGKYVVIFKYLL